MQKRLTLTSYIEAQNIIFFGCCKSPFPFYFADMKYLSLYVQKNIADTPGKLPECFVVFSRLCMRRNSTCLEPKSSGDFKVRLLHASFYFECGVLLDVKAYFKPYECGMKRPRHRRGAAARI